MHLLCPLNCTECNNELRGPVRLPCQHSFCKACLDSKSSCPVCGVEFCASKLTVDRILNYLIDSSHELVEVCGNCDKQSQPMSFCDTCQQPLCENCVRITHSAKFFASHHISPLDERGRLRGNLVCAEHNNQFVLYCQEARKLMCIECFNASSLERRNNFVNIDLAHKTCREKLDKSVIRLRSFQNELKEQSEVQARLLSETEAKFALAEEQLLDKYQKIVDTLTRKKDELVEEIHVKREKQMHQIERQITALANMEGPIQLNLLSASVFCSYASNLDLLHCYFDLSKNIHAVMSHNKLEKISFKDNAPIDYVECLMTTLHELDIKSTDANKENLENGAPNTFPFVSLDVWRRMDQRTKQDYNDASRSLSPLSFNHASQNNYHCNNSFFLLDSALNSFDEHFQRIDAPIRQFLDETNSISKDLLDVQRDITLRRCMIKKQTVEGLFERCSSLSSRLNAHSALIQQIRPQLTDHWNEQLEALYKQQSMVHSRLNDLSKLQNFTQQALEIGNKLRPLSNFLSSVIGAVDNRRTSINQVSPMEQICLQILNILPDSRQRVEAIDQMEVGRSVMRENEKLAADKEAQALKKNLKETKRSKQRPISTIVVEQNRDRDDTISPGLSQKLQKKRQKRTSQSDEASSVCSVSPRTLSSTVSLDINTTDMPSPNSLSPLPVKRAESVAEIVTPVTPPLAPTPPPVSSSHTATEDNRQPVPKLPIPIPASNAPTAEALTAHTLLLQAIKEKVKRID